MHVEVFAQVSELLTINIVILYINAGINIINLHTVSK